MTPSRHITPNRMLAMNATGMSLRTVERAIIMGATTAATPTMSRVLKMLLPTTLPMAISAEP